MFREEKGLTHAACSVNRDAWSCWKCNHSRTTGSAPSGSTLLLCEVYKAAWPVASFLSTLNFKGTKNFKSSLKALIVFCMFSLSSGMELGQSHSHKNTVTEDRHTFLSYMKTPRSGRMLRHWDHLFTLIVSHLELQFNSVCFRFAGKRPLCHWRCVNVTICLGATAHQNTVVSTGSGDFEDCSNDLTLITRIFVSFYSIKIWNSLRVVSKLW